MNNIIFLIPDNIENIGEILSITEKPNKSKYDIGNKNGYTNFMKYIKQKEYPTGYSFLFWRTCSPEDSEFFVDGGFVKIDGDDDGNYSLILYRQPPKNDKELNRYLTTTRNLIKTNIAKLNSLKINVKDKDKFLEIRYELAKLYYQCQPELEVFDRCLFVDTSKLIPNKKE